MDCNNIIAGFDLFICFPWLIITSHVVWKTHNIFNGVILDYSYYQTDMTIKGALGNGLKTFGISLMLIKDQRTMTRLLECMIQDQGHSTQIKKQKMVSNHRGISYEVFMSLSIFKLYEWSIIPSSFIQ